MGAYLDSLKRNRDTIDASKDVETVHKEFIDLVKSVNKSLAIVIEYPLPKFIDPAAGDSSERREEKFCEILASLPHEIQVGLTFKLKTEPSDEENNQFLAFTNKIKEKRETIKQGEFFKIFTKKNDYITNGHIKDHCFIVADRKNVFMGNSVKFVYNDPSLGNDVKDEMKKQIYRRKWYGLHKTKTQTDVTEIN